MGEQWVVLELSQRSEGEDPDIIRRSIQQTLRHKCADVFIPAAITQVGEDRVVKYLVEGYAFVRRELPDATYFRLEGSKYVQTLLTTSPDIRARERHIAPVTAADIAKLQRQVRVRSDQGIRINDEVMVTSGPYRGIPGVVYLEIPEQQAVQVYIRLRSKEAMITLPRSFLQLIRRAEDPFPEFLERGNCLHCWVGLVLPIFEVYPNSHTLECSRSSYVRLSTWESRFDRLFALVRAFSVSLAFPDWTELAPRVLRLSDLERRYSMAYQAYRVSILNADWDPVRYKHEVWYGYHSLATRYETTWAALRVAALPLPGMALLEQRFLVWRWLDSLVERLDTLASEVISLEDDMCIEDSANMDNIIVDGYNLAYRALMAVPRNKDGTPKGDLMDAKGRPTGLIFRFLQSLVSLRKRFDRATLYICWDGSPQKRRDMFAGYKASRGPSLLLAKQDGFEPLQYLRDLLPCLGVHQVYSPDEEADDMIASLVRGPLKGARNVIVSTDRDFLQLVTRTDIVLTPKMGSGKETIYDVDTVTQEYGVPPERMVALRAMLGDTSDEIPGVPRVPTKVITSLLRAHDSIDGIYSSNFAGVTQFQFETLRASERQVRLNLKLMALNFDLPVPLQEGHPDAEEAKSRLADVDVKAEPILEGLLSTPEGFAKEA